MEAVALAVAALLLVGWGLIAWALVKGGHGPENEQDTEQ